MGKATKRDRQKSNKAIKEQERAKIEKRAKSIRAGKTLAAILIVPLVIIGSMVINKATTDAIYTAKISLSIDGKEAGDIEIRLDEANAPKSVKHFIGYASNQVYDGLAIDAAIKDSIISGGSANEDGTGSLGTTIKAEFPPRDFKQGDFIWQPDQTSSTPGLAGSAFMILTGSDKSEYLKILNTKTDGNEEVKSTYKYGYIGSVTKGLKIAQQIEKLAPEAEIDPATGQIKLDEKGQPVSPKIKPTKVVKILEVRVYKDGKQINPGDFANLVTTSTTTIPGSETTAPVVAP